MIFRIWGYFPSFRDSVIPRFPLLGFGVIFRRSVIPPFRDSAVPSFRLVGSPPRFIYFTERNQHMIPLFIDAGVLPLKFLYYELLTNLTFEIRHRNARGNIQDLFQDISDIQSYNTRSSASNNFYTQSSRLSIQVNSFYRTGKKIWIEMPMSIRKLPKNVFKRKIKQILFEILG